MNRINSIILAAAMAAMAGAFTACVSDEPVDRPKIALTATLDGTNASRSTNFSSSNLPKNIFVTATFTSNGTQYFANATFNGIEGSSYTNSEYIWPTKTLPLKFTAWAAGDGLSIEGDGDTRTVTPVEDIAGHDDLIFATTGTDGYTSADNFTLNFGHRLTSIDVRALNSNEAYTISVDGFAIRNAISSASFNTSTGELTAGENKTDYTLSYADSPIPLSETASSLLPSGAAIIIPQGNFKDWKPGSAYQANEDNNGLYIALHINVANANGANIFPQADDPDNDPHPYGWAAIPLSAIVGTEAHDWISGRRITITLNLSAGLGYVDPTDDWDYTYTEKGDIIPFSEILPGIQISTEWSDKIENDVDYNAPTESSSQTTGSGETNDGNQD